MHVLVKIAQVWAQLEELTELTEGSSACEDVEGDAADEDFDLVSDAWSQGSMIAWNIKNVKGNAIKKKYEFFVIIVQFKSEIKLYFFFFFWRGKKWYLG